MRIGLIGLGNMGRGMAIALIRGGHGVIAWNRTASRAEALRSEGVRVAATPADAARAGIVVSMLADDDAIAEVSDGPTGLLKGLPSGGLHVSASTISPETADRLAAAHDAAGQIFVSAAVLGRPDAAAAGKLSVIAAGKPDAVALAQPLLKALGQQVFVVGQRPSDANLVKIAANFVLSAAIEALGESLALVGKAGVDREAFVRVLTETLFSAPAYKTYGRVLLEGEFSPPGFRLPLGMKDNRLAIDAGKSLNVPLPLAELIRDRMTDAQARGYGDLDWSVFGRLSEEDAGRDTDSR